jgi:hypothetical protein
MEKVKVILKAVYASPKVRLAGKGLLLAIAAVIGDHFGAGDLIVKLIG